MTSDTQRFKAGSGVYTCRDCGKDTRATGQGEEGVELCRHCYEDAGMENEHNDGHHDGNPQANCRQCQAKAEVVAASPQRPRHICETCHYGTADTPPSPGGPEDGVACTNPAMIQDEGQADEYQERGNLNLWRIEVIAPDCECDEWAIRGTVQVPATYRTTKEVQLECSMCQPETTLHTVDADWSTGKPLANGYKPAVDEAVKSHHIVCTQCGTWQAS